MSEGYASLGERIPKKASDRRIQRAFSHIDNEEIEGKLKYSTFRKMIGKMTLEDMIEHRAIIDQLTDKFKENWSRGLGSESFVEDTFMRTQLRDCVFVGHINTDLDSIAGAISAAELFGGLATRSEKDFNGEIECALKYVGMDAPPVFANEKGAGITNDDGKLLKVCLVDHNETSQMAPALMNGKDWQKRIIGLIDHHALSQSFFTSNPLFMDVRPWGSMCSIIFHNYLRSRVPIRKEIARLMMCAILSDTLNLRSGTTTPADRFSVALLASFGEVEDIDGLAMQLFQAKTQWIVGLGAYEMCRGDQKYFKIDAKLQGEEDPEHVTECEVKLSLAVLEVTDIEPVLEVAEDLLTQIRVFKYEAGDEIVDETDEKSHDVTKEAHCALLFVVNTLTQTSVCLVCGSRELLVAERAFPEASWRRACPDIRAPSKYMTSEQTLCDVGKLCSRKLEFMPMTIEALKKEPLPHWFLEASPDMNRLAIALQNPDCTPINNKNQSITWDKDFLNGAVFFPAEAFDEAKAKELFGILDHNGNGQVSKTELRKKMKEFPDIKTRLGLKRFGDAAKLIGVADADNDGQMNYNEFVSLWRRLII